MNVNFQFDYARYQRYLSSVPTLVSEHEEVNKEELKTLISCIDNTTLNGNDTEASVRDFASHTVAMHNADIPYVAALCIYPYFVPLLRKQLGSSPLAIASVAGGFPAGQLPLQLKLDEVRWVVDAGADEVDYVINRGLFLSQGSSALFDEVAAAREACGHARLKVILETAEIPSPELIYQAAIATLSAGADFVKTSTGKLPLGATPEAACAMLMAVADYRQFSKKCLGFKAAGAVRTLAQAQTYYRLAKKILSLDFLDKQLFRIGASSLINQILKYLTV